LTIGDPVTAAPPCTSLDEPAAWDENRPIVTGPLRDFGGLLMRRMTALLALVLLASPAAAADDHPSLARILVASDRIVVGVVTRAEDRAIDLRIDYVVHGPGTAGETIAIRVPRVSRTDARWLSPEIDRRLLLFLADDPEESSNPYRLVAVGGEGGSAPGNGSDESAASGRTRVSWSDGPRGLLWSTDLATFRATVRDFHETFSYGRPLPCVMIDGAFVLRVTTVGFVRNTPPAPVLTTFRKRRPPGSPEPAAVPFEKRSHLHRILYDEATADLLSDNERRMGIVSDGSDE
jgi:hypothetical protein